MTVQEELQSLQQFAAIGKQFQNTDLEHLDGPMSAYNYIRVADMIAEDFLRQGEAFRERKGAPFLDWGAGYGQLTWLLKNRGVNVQGYNIEEREHVLEIPELAALPIKIDHDPVKLPFPDESFAGVSSCGVLEHVFDPAASLQEIHRILKPQGAFYLFMLPQQTSWVEKLSEIRGCSVHPVRYTVRRISSMLREAGFRIEHSWKFNLIPKNLTGLPSGIKKWYGKYYRLLYPMDRVLSGIPGLNLLSGVIECIARKK